MQAKCTDAAATVLSSDVSRCVYVQQATIYMDYNELLKKEYTFKIQKVEKTSKGDDERKTIGKVKVCTLQRLQNGYVLTCSLQAGVRQVLASRQTPEQTRSSLEKNDNSVYVCIVAD
jgi:hypothetical protein